MSRQLSAAAKQAIYNQQTDEVFAILMTIDHPNFTQPILVSSDNGVILPSAGVRGTLSRGKEYVFLPFTIELPTQDDTGIARARISIDNIDRQMVNAVRSANSALKIKIEIVLASTPDVVEVVMDDFQINQVTYDALTISGELSLEYYDLEPYSKLRFTPSNFPGMF